MAVSQPLLFLSENLIPPHVLEISLPVLGKMSVQEKNITINRVAESMESIVDKIATQNKSPLPLETSRSKSEYEIFGKIILKIGYWSNRV